MKEAFKAGDRVRAYGINWNAWNIGGSVVSDSSICGEVVEARLGYLKIKRDSGSFRWVHSKQCRRLKPKRKAREWTIMQDSDVLGHWKIMAGPLMTPCVRDEIVRVREILE